MREVPPADGTAPCVIDERGAQYCEQVACTFSIVALRSCFIFALLRRVEEQVVVLHD